MSIISAILSSRSGLTAAAQRAEIVSGNIANAQDENYARRSLQVTEGVGGGVSVVGVSRAMDNTMDALFRTELSYAAKQNAIANALGVYSSQIGTLDSETSIPNLMSAFQNDLGLMANDPGDTSMQQEVMLSAKALAASLRSANAALSQVQKTALTGIEADIETANTAMAEIARINADIGTVPEGSATYAGLQDRRAEELDKLASVMQIEVRYDNVGQATVNSSGGQTLVVAGYVNELAFDRATGTLTSGDENVTPGTTGRRGSEQGSLAGHLQLALETVPQSQLELDEIARSLIEGFEDSDASLAAGEAGLFTNAGSALGATVSPGLAGRIAVNEAIDPAKGGELTRLRDGLGATTPGAASDSTQVRAFLDFFSAAVSFDPQAGQGSSGTMSEFVNGVFTAQQSRRVAAESSLSALTASSETYRATRLNARGVNIDTELQNLQMIEQSYNANSQVLRVASEMIDTLLNMV